MPHLTLLDKSAQKGHRIDGVDAIVGRDPGCSIVVDGEEAKTVSARHARFYITDGKWVVEDAGSRNGTFIGTRKLERATPHVLEIGDVIGLGLTGTQFLVQDLSASRFVATVLEPAQGRPDLGRSANTAQLATAVAMDVRVTLVGRDGTRLTAQGDRLTIGRSLESLLRIEGEAATSVSRNHAEIIATDGRILVRDIGSRHGTYVNGQKIEGHHLLSRGDELGFGPLGQVFTVDEAVVLPPGAPRIAPPRPQDEPFRAELPTPALARSPIRVNNTPDAMPARPRAAAPVPTSSSRTGDIPGPASRKRMIAGGVAGVAALVAIVGFVAYSSGQDSAGQFGVTQQSVPIDTIALVEASQQASFARAALDLVIRTSRDTVADRETLDSLRRVIDSADARVRKASGFGR